MKRYNLEGGSQTQLLNWGTNCEPMRLMCDYDKIAPYMLKHYINVKFDMLSQSVVC